MKENNLQKNFIKYVSLNVIGMIGLSCYILADTFFVSKALGATGLAALNFSISIYCIIHGAGLMIGIGGATRYAILKCKGEEEQANAVFTHTVIVGIFIGLLLFLVGAFLSTPLAALLGGDKTTLEMASTYLQTILCFSPFFILNNVLLAFVRNDGHPKLSMTAMLVGSFSNIVLDYVFVFPMGMGMFGAAFATGLAPVISIGVMSILFIKKRNRFKPVKCRLVTSYIKDIFSLGLSAFVTEVSSGIVLMVFNLVILGLEGNIGVAAYGIVANIALVVTAIFTGIAQGIQPLASNGYAENDRHQLKRLLGYAFSLALVVATLVYLVILLCSGGIIKIFNSENNTALIPLATEGFRIYFVGFFFAGFNLIAAAFLSAIEKPRQAFVISISRGCIFLIPFVLVLTLWFQMKGVWLSFVLAEVATVLLTAICLVRANRALNKEHELSLSTTSRL